MILPLPQHRIYTPEISIEHSIPRYRFEKENAMENDCT